jgi:hypothetical protein
MRVGQHSCRDETLSVGDHRGIGDESPRDLAGLQEIDPLVPIVKVPCHAGSLPVRTDTV